PGQYRRRSAASAQEGIPQIASRIRRVRATAPGIVDLQGRRRGAESAQVASHLRRSGDVEQLGVGADTPVTLITRIEPALGGATAEFDRPAKYAAKLVLFIGSHRCSRNLGPGGGVCLIIDKRVAGIERAVAQKLPDV